MFCLFILYFFLPALTGPFWGWQWVLWPLLISSLGNLLSFSGVTLSILESSLGSSSRRSVAVNSSRGKVAAGIFGLIFVGIIGLVATFLISIFTTWFDGNAKALAAIPNVKVEKSSQLPPTDASNIVLVSHSVAAYKGQQVLGSTGQNLGSAYNLDQGSYTLQSIKHR